MSDSARSNPAHALTLQFLAWVAEDMRTYAQAMEAWRSSCPRLSIWEDAILDGLVAFDGGASRDRSRVMLTPKGRALLRAEQDTSQNATHNISRDAGRGATRGPRPRVAELARSS
jgi:hypothetical protein